MSGLEALVFVGFIVLVVLVYFAKEARLADPDRSGTVRTGDMRLTCTLPPGPVSAALLRQSGRLYRDLGQFSYAGEAFNEIERRRFGERKSTVYMFKKTR